MSDATKIKRDNIQQVLRILRDTREITKPEISQQTGITGVTVNTIMTNLEAVGLVRRGGFSSSNGGRKAQYFSLNGEYGIICGVSLRTDCIVVGLMNFVMELQCKRSFAWQLENHSVEETTNKIASFVMQTMAEQKVEHLLGIGINAPGPVDYERGEILTLRGYPKWRRVPLAESLSKLLGVPVSVDKDVNSGIALIDFLQPAKGQRNMIYLSVEGGIGCGVMIHGETYRGNHGVAGEIGHTTVLNNHEKCSCGNVGCLELVSSDFAIIRKCRQALKIPEEIAFGIDDAIAAYRSGEQVVEEIFNTAIEYLATTIRNAFMLYDPDEAFIRCKWLSVNESLFFRLVEELYVDNTLLETGSIRVTLLREKDFVLRSAGMLAWNRALVSFPE